MEYLNLYEVRNIIGDYSNMNFDKNFIPTYKHCDICKKTVEEYYHIKSDPLYILNDSPSKCPIIMKRNPYNSNWVLVKGDIREKYFPNDMIWVRNVDVIKIRTKFFPNMDRMKFYEFICDSDFFLGEFFKDFKIITHCSDCKESALLEAESVDNNNNLNLKK